MRMIFVAIALGLAVPVAAAGRPQGPPLHGWAHDAIRHAAGEACYRSGLVCDCRSGICEGHDGYAEAVAASEALASQRLALKAMRLVGCAPALTWGDGSVTFDRGCIRRLGPAWRDYAGFYERHAYDELRPGEPYYKPGAP